MDTSKTRTQNGLAAYAAPETNGRILWSFKYGVRQWQHMHATKTKDYIRLVVPWTNDHMTKLWNSHEWPMCKDFPKKENNYCTWPIGASNVFQPIGKNCPRRWQWTEEPTTGTCSSLWSPIGAAVAIGLAYIFWVSRSLASAASHIGKANRLILKQHLVGNMTMKTYENHIRKNNTLSKEDQRSLHLPPALHDVAFLGWIFYDSFKKVLVWVTSKYQGITLVTRIWNCNHLVYGRL